MKYALVAIAVLTGCGQGSPPVHSSQTAQAQMRTIDAVDPRPVVIDPPPMLSDESPPPKPKSQPWETPEPIVLTPEDEKIRSSLPFSPAIAMDPVDGSKISIRANTPALEHQGRIYYFSSEANRKAFVANPDDYTKGAFSKL